MVQPSKKKRNGRNIQCFIDALRRGQPRKCMLFILCISVISCLLSMSIILQRQQQQQYQCTRSKYNK